MIKFQIYMYMYYASQMCIYKLQSCPWISSLHLNKIEYTTNVHVYKGAFILVKSICDLVMPENEIYFVQFGQTSFYIIKIKGCFHITWIIVTLLFFLHTYIFPIWNTEAQAYTINDIHKPRQSRFEVGLLDKIHPRIIPA